MHLGKQYYCSIDIMYCKLLATDSAITCNKPCNIPCTVRNKHNVVYDLGSAKVIRILTKFSKTYRLVKFSYDNIVKFSYDNRICH